MRQTSFGQALYELFSSMRFAVSLLVIIAIAAIVGTVLLQNQPYPNYIVQFGEFWFRPFEAIGLFDVYHAGWFLAMLVFLVTSTSLCIYRHIPGIVRDIRHYREQAALKSLRAISHRAEYAYHGDTQQASTLVGQWISAQGYRTKQTMRDDGLMLASKKGSMQRIGYLFAHAAIVVICIGGLLDGNVPLKVQQWLHLKEAETRNVSTDQISTLSRLSPDNLSFRADIDMPEGGSRDLAFVSSGRGYFVQDLPFTLRLKSFHIEHYSTGQPKLFASDIEVIDKATGKVTTGTVQVNHPLKVDGIAIYQSSFGDGGSPLEFNLWDWSGKQVDAQAYTAVSQNTQQLVRDGHPLSLEFGDFRVFNIENMDAPGQAADQGLGKRLQDAREVTAKKHVKNIGPSIQFKVRDAEGQAHEYLNYLAPFEEEGHLYLLSGMRTEPSAPFAYIRIPLDADNKPDTFMRLRAILLDKSTHAEIARRASSRVSDGGDRDEVIRKGLEQGLNVVLQQFASGGMEALNRFVIERFPEKQREGASRATIELLQRAEVEALNMDRERRGEAPVDMAQPDERRDHFLLDCLSTISDSFSYGTNFYLQPTGFREIKSSGFQLTRAPGETLIYLGSVLLVLGIFCMFYIRENRVWIWFGEGRLLLAFTSNRHDDQTDREFAAYQAAIQQLAGVEELRP